MAAGTVNVLQAEDWLALAVKDRANEFLVAQEYAALVLDYVETKQSWNCALKGSGSKIWSYGSGPVHLTGVSEAVPGFTIVDNVDYLVNAGSPSHNRGTLTVKASGSGTDNSDPLVVSGLRVNFKAALALLDLIATQKAPEYNQTIHGGGFTVDQTVAQIRKQMSQIQGVVAL
jgi:hypothetical protein